MFFKKWFIVIWVLIIPVAGMCDSINWRSYDEGIEEARQEDKKIFLHFKSNRCRYCVLMDRNTFSDPGVVDFLNEHYVSILVNGDKQPRLVRQFKVNAYPENQFYDQDKQFIYRIPGYQDHKTFMVFLEYVQTDSYKTMNPMEFYESR